ncbi:hypothetical protein M0R45_029857 [Rubus argutus]|uniref:Uncharacterized protein n=1 Tax=Rubus argutus TaxID=59490 RepID=A0AAW1W9H1_RUBAR
MIQIGDERRCQVGGKGFGVADATEVNSGFERHRGRRWGAEGWFTVILWRNLSSAWVGTAEFYEIVVVNL